MSGLTYELKSTVVTAGGDEFTFETEPPNEIKILMHLGGNGTTHMINISHQDLHNFLKALHHLDSVLEARV